MDLNKFRGPIRAICERIEIEGYQNNHPCVVVMNQHTFEVFLNFYFGFNREKIPATTHAIYRSPVVIDWRVSDAVVELIYVDRDGSTTVPRIKLVRIDADGPE